MPYALGAFALALCVVGVLLGAAAISVPFAIILVTFAMTGAFLLGKLSAGKPAPEVEQLKRELLEAEEKAMAARDAKSDFIATVSHEIRTPMNGVIGFTEVALAGDLDDELRANLEMLAESGRSMLALLNDLLDTAKINAGRIEVAFEPINIEQRLSSAVSLMAPLAAQKGVELDIEVDDALPDWIEGDPTRLRQILLNLIGNAVKFTEQGRITVSAGIEPDGLTYAISVRDTGIGIAEDKLVEIFDRFTQADPSIDRRFGGTGLGLSICARLAELLGGYISVDSKLGEGSTFTLSLPLVKTGAPRRRMSDNAVTPSQNGTGLRARILVAEDDEINQEVAKAILARLGHRVTVAGNGRLALEKIQSAQQAGEPFDLVLMDQQLPGMDGLEATRALRDQGIDASALPIIAVTANASAEHAAACLEAGMQAHLAKPYGLDELHEVLDRWIPREVGDSDNREPRKPSARLVRNFSERKALALHAIDESVRKGSLESCSLEELANQLHQIAGVAAFFGESDLGASCSKLDERLRKEPGALEANDFDEVRNLLRA